MRGAFVTAIPVAFLVLALGLACGSSLPTPAYTSHPTSALLEVPYPPPPARVENIPREPKGDVVWIDGEWTWQSRRWAWKPGRWVVPPAGARFAPWTTVRDRLGTLYFAGGTWRDKNGAEVAEPPPAAAAGPFPVAVVTPEGEEVKQGPEAPLDAGPTSSRSGDASADLGLADLDASGSSVKDAAAVRDGATMDAESP